MRYGVPTSGGEPAFYHAGAVENPTAELPLEHVVDIRVRIKIRRIRVSCQPAAVVSGDACLVIEPEVSLDLRRPGRCDALRPEVDAAWLQLDVVMIISRPSERPKAVWVVKLVVS